MTHGAPDWCKEVQVLIGGLTLDIWDLMAITEGCRSIHPFGKILFSPADIGSGKNGFFYTDHVGQMFYTYSQYHARISSQSVKLIQGVSNAWLSGWIWAFPLPESGVYGFELSSTWEGFCDKVWFSMRYFDGTNAHRGYIAWNRQTQHLFYLNNVGGETDMGVYANQLLAGKWDTIKWVGDFINNKYGDLYYNGNKITTQKGQSFYTVANGTSPYFEVWFYAWDHGTPSATYIDQPIITIYEIIS
jgi:hypothetical protein